MTIRLLGPVMGTLAKRDFPNDTAAYCIVQKSNLELTTLCIVNLCSYPLSCIAAKFEILAIKFFFKNTTARYAQCEHQTRNLTIK